MHSDTAPPINVNFAAANVCVYPPLRLNTIVTSPQSIMQGLLIHKRGRSLHKMAGLTGSSSISQVLTHGGKRAGKLESRSPAAGVSVGKFSGVHSLPEKHGWTFPKKKTLVCVCAVLQSAFYA